MSATSKILSTVRAHGYLQQDPATGKFKLTFKLIALVQRHRDSLKLEDYYQPILQTVAQKTGELVQLGVVVNEESMVTVGKVEGEHPLRIASRVGWNVSLHATAVGKAWLASLDPTHAIEIVMRKDGLRRFTNRTITTVPALLDELAAVATRGYAIADEECIAGVIGVAAPVRVNGKVTAAVGIAIPSSRATADSREEAGQLLIDAADQLAESWPEAWRSITPTGSDGATAA